MIRLVYERRWLESTKPTSVAHLDGFLPAATAVVDMANEAQDLDATLVPGLGALAEAVERLRALTGGDWPEELFRSLATLAETVSGELQRRRQGVVSTVKVIETELIGEAVPKNDEEGRRLDVYRRQLERRLQGLFDRLEVLRRLRPTSSGSFDRPVQVHLRPAPERPGLACQ